MKNKSFAFTLAELLITIGIIGVVAAITIPGLVEKYQKKVTVEKLKVAYSIFSQAVRRSVEDNGDVASWEFSYSDMAEKYIAPYVGTLGTVKRYGMTTTGGGNTLYWGGWGSAGKIYSMKNGMTYSLIYDHSDLVLMVDMNGISKPNRLGRDGFAFTINQNKNKLDFSGEGYTRAQITGWRAESCVPNGWAYYGGMDCGALIKKDGWKISDDYPW